MTVETTPSLDATATIVPFPQGYQVLSGFYDEMVEGEQAIRPQWQQLIRELNSLTLLKLKQRWDEARKLVHECGLAFNFYDDAHGDQRPWQLDPIPLVVSPQQTQVIEAGLIQRAKLLEKILADIYGPQDLLNEGLIPPDLVFGHPAFLRCCHGIKFPGNHHISLYAADLGTGPDGSVCVLSERTEAPSGIGFALENRIVLSRMLPEIFSQCRVQRLALFFHLLRENIRSLAPKNKENPRVVLLSPGPKSENYYGHAYFARYLGYTLVEGGDLTVRDNQVFLKLLGGLQPVDVIFRRIPGDLCDPLELGGDSVQGVAGLVQVVRTGNVAVVNSLGSGLAESPAFMPYLPELSRRLLGEDLLLPSAPAWWCGDPASCDHVLANLSQMVIKPTYASPDLDPIFGEKLTQEEQTELKERILNRPRDFVGQQQVPLSTAPILAKSQLEPRHVVLRAFLTAQDDSFMIMPGGLARATTQLHSVDITPRNGWSKDTWVLADGPVSSFSLLRDHLKHVEINRGGGDLPSRAADNLFWLGRYVARADSTVRLLRAILVRMTESSGIREVPELPLLVRALVNHSGTLPAGMKNPTKFQVSTDELSTMIFDGKKSSSLAFTLNSLYNAAQMSRDQISTDMWRILSSLDLTHLMRSNQIPNSTGKDAHQNNGFDDPHRTLSEILEVLSQMVINLAAFGGLATESMTRGQGWRFLDMGRRLERSIQIVHLIRSTLTSAISSENILLEALLEIFDSSMTYRRRYLSSPEVAPVLDLLIADEKNPRSLAFQLEGLNNQVENLPRNPGDARRSEEERVLLALWTEIRLAEMEPLAESEENGKRIRLEKLLEKFEKQLPLISETISRSFLTHLKPSRQMATLNLKQIQ